MNRLGKLINLRLLLYSPPKEPKEMIVVDNRTFVHCLGFDEKLLVAMVLS